MVLTHDRYINFINAHGSAARRGHAGRRGSGSPGRSASRDSGGSYEKPPPVRVSGRLARACFVAPACTQSPDVVAEGLNVVINSLTLFFRAFPSAVILARVIRDAVRISRTRKFHRDRCGRGRYSPRSFALPAGLFTHDHASKKRASTRMRKFFPITQSRVSI